MKLLIYKRAKHNFKKILQPKKVQREKKEKNTIIKLVDPLLHLELKEGFYSKHNVSFDLEFHECEVF